MLTRAFRLVLSLLLVLMGVASCGGGGSEQTTNDRVELLVALPVSVVQGNQGIRLFPESTKASPWTAYRVWPRGQIAIFYSAPNSPTVAVTDSGFSHLLPRRFLELNSELWMVAYNPGKFNSGNHRPIEIWKFDPTTGSAKMVAEDLTIGGIEDHLHLSSRDDGIDACDQHACVSVSNDGRQSDWHLPNDIGARSIVEAAFFDDGGFVIVRSHLSEAQEGRPPFSVRFIPRPASSSPARTVADLKDCIPFNLRVEDTKAKWSCARTKQELAQLLNFDLSRLPNGGLNDLGLPNDDGRIAWSQTYTVGALIRLSERNTPELWLAGDWRDLKALAGPAIDLIARQGEFSLSGYYSTRYSLHAEPLLFAVHLARIAALLEDAKEDGTQTDAVNLVSTALYTELRSLTGTLETFDRVGEFNTLRFRRGAAFWADGVNAPYNFLSAYVAGLLSSSQRTADDLSRAKEMMAPLLSLETVATNPDWRYWWGLGASGWTADMGVSTHTPDFSGLNSVADITYRSMDAVALLQLARQDSATVPPDIVEALRTYVMKGQLLPSVSLQLKRNGAALVLTDPAALVRARSAAPWEVEDQLFALESLMTSWAR